MTVRAMTIRAATVRAMSTATRRRFARSVVFLPASRVPVEAGA